MLHIYALENCPYSIDAVKLAKDKGIKYKEYWINRETKDKYKIIHNINSFPQIFYEHIKVVPIKNKNKHININNFNNTINKNHMHAIGGFDEFELIVSVSFVAGAVTVMTWDVPPLSLGVLRIA